MEPQPVREVEYPREVELATHSEACPNRAAMPRRNGKLDRVREHLRPFVLPLLFLFFWCESLLQGLLDTALDGLPVGLFLPTTVISSVVGAETPPSTGYVIRLTQDSSSV